jgi:hypothetical protein
VKPYTLEELLDFGREHAEKSLIGVKGAQLLPTFHIQFTDRPPAIMATPWRNDREKRMAIGAIRAAIQHFRASIDSYSFMTEAWLATQTHAPRSTDLPPSEREDRKECVIITCCNKDGGFMRAFEIKRAPDATVCELVAEKEAGKCDRFEGPLFNLFEDP